MHVLILLCIYVHVYMYWHYANIYIIQKLKSQKRDVLEWILNKKTHFQLSQIIRLFYITFYSVTIENVFFLFNMYIYVDIDIDIDR